MNGYDSLLKRPGCNHSSTLAPSYETVAEPLPTLSTDGTDGPFAGSIPGFGTCDQNIFKGTQADLDALWQKYA